MKIRQVGADLFPGDRKKKGIHDEAKSCFWRFCNAHKNISTFMVYPSHVQELKRSTISSHSITIKEQTHWIQLLKRCQTCVQHKLF